MLTILAGVATWEREIMLERQREGIAKAKAAGKYKGRPISIDAAQIRQLRAELGPQRSRSVSASRGVRSIARLHERGGQEGRSISLPPPDRAGASARASLGRHRAAGAG